MDTDMIIVDSNCDTQQSPAEIIRNRLTNPTDEDDKILSKSAVEPHLISQQIYQPSQKKSPEYFYPSTWQNIKYTFITMTQTEFYVSIIKLILLFANIAIILNHIPTTTTTTTIGTCPQKTINCLANGNFVPICSQYGCDMCLSLPKGLCYEKITTTQITTWHFSNIFTFSNFSHFLFMCLFVFEMYQLFSMAFLIRGIRFDTVNSAMDFISPTENEVNASFCTPNRESNLAYDQTKVNEALATVKRPPIETLNKLPQQSIRVQEVMPMPESFKIVPITKEKFDKATRPPK